MPRLARRGAEHVKAGKILTSISNPFVTPGQGKAWHDAPPFDGGNLSRKPGETAEGAVMRHESAVQDTTFPVRMADLVEEAFTAPLSAQVRDVKKDIASREDPISSIVVVEQGRPQGLVMSLHLDRVLSQQYGVALYHKKPVAEVMDAAPLVADMQAPVDAVAEQAMRRDRDKLFDHVIVTENDLLKGIVTVERILSTLASLHQRRTQEMAAINRELQKAQKKTAAMNEELSEAYVKLRELDELKTDFLSMVSHELRTPLTSVLGFTEITQLDLRNVIFPHLEAKSPPSSDAAEKKLRRARENVEKNLEIIIKEGERLTVLINDVLDIAKMEAGKVDWKSQSLDIGDLVSRAMASTSSLFQKKHLDAVVEVETGLPPLVGDGDRLIQVLVNLVSNAVKFTDAGSVSCSATRHENGVLVSVRDTGIGIAKDDLDKVFEKFKQAGDTLTNKPAGTGLGLPICKQIIEHHGGRIGVESEPGKGSVFWFTLPGEAAVRRSEHKAVVAFAESNGPFYYLALARRVGLGNGTKPQPGVPRPGALLVMANQRVRSFLRQRVESYGVAVHEAGSVNEALTVAKRAPLRIVVLDLEDPELKGLELAAALRKQRRTQDVRFLCTNYGGESEQGFALALDRLFTRPVRRDALLEELELLQPPLNVPVLVADDDHDLVKSCIALLAKSGREVHGAKELDSCLGLARDLRPSLLVAGARFASRYNILRTVRFEQGQSALRAMLLG